MSFDLSDLSNKNDLPSPPSGPVIPSPNTLYQRRKTQLENRITRRLQNTDSLPLRVRVDFLTDQDKNSLDAALQAKGYTCNVSGRFMILE